jgi:EAL domain-containing protein (putative c-di-GMP-specific phosphodiesterase class I)
VHEIDKNHTAQDIVKSMIELCGNLKLVCVTEGVETTRQYELLRSFGCDEVQGYLFSRPIAEDEVARFIAETSREQMARRA